MPGGCSKNTVAINGLIEKFIHLVCHSLPLLAQQCHQAQTVEMVLSVMKLGFQPSTEMILYLFPVKQKRAHTLL